MTVAEDWHLHQRFGPATYAQHGDDIVLACLFERLQSGPPSYLDLGANEPIALSNTWLFYSRGASGVLVEADPDLIPALRRERPRDYIINAAVAGSRSTRQFFRGQRIQSFDRELAEWHGPVKSIVDLQTVTLGDIVQVHCNNQFPDLLSIDVEGMDAEVLSHIGCVAPGPKVIIAECITGWETTDQIRDLLMAHGYSFVIRCCNNAIFVRNDLKGRLCY